VLLHGRGRTATYSRLLLPFGRLWRRVEPTLIRRGRSQVTNRRPSSKSAKRVRLTRSRRAAVFWQIRLPVRY
jgi:hypothetical protein